jgi:hypothetical protein
MPDLPLLRHTAPSLFAIARASAQHSLQRVLRALRAFMVFLTYGIFCIFTVAQAASRGQRVHDSTLQQSTGVKIQAAEDDHLDEQLDPTSATRTTSTQPINTSVSVGPLGQIELVTHGNGSTSPSNQTDNIAMVVGADGGGGPRLAHSISYRRGRVKVR